MKKPILIVWLSLLSLAASAKVIVLSGLTNSHTGTAGDVVEGEITVQNIGDKEERILVYLNDLVQDCDSAATYSLPGSHLRSSADWFDLNASDRVLAPNEEFVIRYQLAVPDDKSLNGSYWTMVMIEIVDPIKEDQLEYGVSMDSKIRYGIQVITDIGEKTNSELEFVAVDLLPFEDGGYILTATTHNQGEFLVTPTVILELYDKNAELVLKTEVPFKKVYPGSCKSFEVAIDNVPKGSYDALIVADYGKDLFGTNLELNLN